MNTIQVEEESAIIPLKRLNQYKENERVWKEQINTRTAEFFAISTRYDYQSGTESVQVFSTHEWDVKRNLEAETERYKRESESLENQLKLKEKIIEARSKEIEAIQKNLGNVKTGFFLLGLVIAGLVFGIMSAIK